MNGTYTDVDVTKFDYALVNPASSSDVSDPTLFLSGILRTGMNSITIGKVSMDGRVDYNYNDAVMPLNRPRIASITNELGAKTSVEYSDKDCTAAQIDSINWLDNGKRCFKRFFKPEGAPADFGTFHKYVVLSTTTTPAYSVVPAAGKLTAIPDRKTTYTYPADQAAWAWDDDPVASRNQQAHGQWRGYETVTVRQMSDAGYRGTTSVALTKTDYMIFRGMHGTRETSTTTKTSTLSPGDGTTYTDYPSLAGRILRTVVSEVSPTGSDIGDLRREITSYSRLDKVAAPIEPGVVHDSYVVVPDLTTVTEFPQAATPRVVKTNRGYDGEGRLIEEIRSGDVADRCTSTNYAAGTSATMIAQHKRDYASSIETHAGSSCTGTLTSKTDTFYDGNTALTGQNITDGLVTKVTRSVSATDTATDRYTYDSYGRVLTATDSHGHITRTAYPAVTAATQTVKVTNPAGHVETTTLESDRLLPAAVTDANGGTTSSTYDTVGRLKSVTLPGDTSATYAFAYAVSKSQPSRITSSRRLATGSMLDFFSYVDAYGLTRQTQEVAGASSMTVTNTRFDELGRVAATSQPFGVAAAAGNSLIYGDSVAASAVNETQTSYDSYSRGTKVAYVGRGGGANWAWTTTYSDPDPNLGKGVTASTTPPAGGVKTDTTTDYLGQVTQLVEGSIAKATHKYSYDSLDRKTKFTDEAGHVSTWGFDLLGRTIATTDPDGGSTTTAYDDTAANTVTVTGAGGESTTTTRDELERPLQITGVTATGATWVTLASYAYDTATLGKGQLASTTITQGGKNYTRKINSYTDHGLPLSTTYTFPILAGLTAPASYTVTAGYNSADQLRTIGYPAAGQLAAETVTTAYDGVTGDADTLSGAVSYVTNVAYNPDSTLKQRVLANGTTPITRSYGYESDTQRLASVATTRGTSTIQDDTYTWNDAGNLTALSVTDQNAKQFTNCYGYDNANRLTHAWTYQNAAGETDTCATTSTSTTLAEGPAGYNTTWTYNMDGDLTAIRRGATTTPIGHDAAAAPHAPTSFGATQTYTYDDHGRQQKRTLGGTTSTLTWNPLGLLTSVATGTSTTTLVHDPDGTRLARVTPDGTATFYIGGCGSPRIVEVVS